MTKPLLILGAGGHGRTLLEAAWLSGRQVLGFIDRNPTVWGLEIDRSCKVLGGDERLLEYSPSEIELVNGIGSTVSLELRAGIQDRLSKAGYAFATVCHPQGWVSPSALLGVGVQVMAGAVIQCGVTIGPGSIINSGAVVDHDCQIGENSHIAPRAVLSGNVSVGDKVHVGAGATVIQGIRLGNGALVAAGAVVLKDVLQGSRVAGMPARTMGKK